MDIEVLLAKAAAVVSLYAAFFHAWVFGLYRRAVDHGVAAAKEQWGCHAATLLRTGRRGYSAVMVAFIWG